jgi:hypothetical protein
MIPKVQKNFFYDGHFLLTHHKKKHQALNNPKTNIL